jgi:hypothetical protein
MGGSVRQVDADKPAVGVAKQLVTGCECGEGLQHDGSCRFATTHYSTAAVTQHLHVVS